jgi:uncharacterized membrane protein YeaQ/YmgE (transglycosylase-associated protein family)
MVTFIVVLIIIGLIAGAVARLLVPGRDSIGLIGTIVLGIVGSFLGGFIENLVQFHRLGIHRSTRPESSAPSPAQLSCC